VFSSRPCADFGRLVRNCPVEVRSFDVLTVHKAAADDGGHKVATVTARSTATSRERPAEREAELLAVGYFHIVYTLPAPLRDIAHQNKRVS
jgi:hypothetical protein